MTLTTGLVGLYDQYPTLPYSHYLHASHSSGAADHTAAEDNADDLRPPTNAQAIADLTAKYPAISQVSQSPLHPLQLLHQPSARTHRQDFALHNGGRDSYYRQAKAVAYRARSAYKLLQIDEVFNLLDYAGYHPTATDGSAVQPNVSTTQRRKVQRAVDLCSAPGSWSQLLVQRLYRDRGIRPPAGTVDVESQLHTASNSSNGTRISSSHNTQIVAVDIQEMAPLDGVHVIQGDITQQAVIDKVVDCFQPVDAKSSVSDQQHPQYLADIVVCDAAPDVTGVHSLDEFMHNTQLLLAALQITTAVLQPGGTFVAKLFVPPQIQYRHNTSLHHTGATQHHSANLSTNYPTLHAQLSQLFTKVTLHKPYSSRPRSAEHFIVCQGYAPPYAGYKMEANPTSQLQYERYISSGDLEGWPVGAVAEEQQQGEESKTSVDAASSLLRFLK